MNESAELLVIGFKLVEMRRDLIDSVVLMDNGKLYVQEEIFNKYFDEIMDIIIYKGVKE